jgi:hypothetical protein
MTTAPEMYVSARRRALAIQVLVGTQIVLILGAAIVWAAGRTVLAHDMFPLEQGVFLVSLIPFLSWVHRSVANLPALGSMNRRFTPSDAVTSFFIPIVNIVRSYQVMAMIWTESQPVLLDENGVPRRRRPTLVTWWWALYVGQMVAPFLVLPLVFGGGGSQAVGSALLHGLRLSVAVMFLVMITATQRRQDAMWDDLQRQRSVPQPTAQYLR